MCQPQEKKKGISAAKLRYRFEVLVIIIGFVLLFFVLGLAALLISSDLSIPDWLLIVLIVPIAPVTAFFTTRYMYMDTASNGVEITENQLSETYSLYIGLAKEMGFGIKKIKGATSLFNQREWRLKHFCGKMLFAQTLRCHSQ